MPVTQRQIAEKLGLSRQAIAFAVSDNPTAHRQLRPETRRRILHAARQMGYVPHQAARRLVRARSARASAGFEQVGLISLGSPMDAVCLAMMGGAEQEISRLRASLMFSRVASPEDWEKIDRLIRSGSVDGWLVYGPADDAVARRLKRNKIPFVVMGDHRCTRPIHGVNVDNVAAGRRAVRHLTALGHRRIAFLSGGSKHVYGVETLAGFRAEVKESGLAEDQQLIRLVSEWDQWRHETFWSPHNAELLLGWLRDASATAVVAPEFDFAGALNRVLEQARIAMPEQISLVSWEPISETAKIENFTRIGLPLIDVGRRAAILLHQVVSEPGMEATEVRIAPFLIEGRSTGPVRR